MNELALFAGAGGGILGGILLGWRTVCAVEIDPYARSVLLARQRDGCLEPFSIWDDVRTFDGHPWRGRVDVISGGFPCVDISCAGKGAGITGERSGLWTEMARIIGEVRPRFVFVENSPMLTSRGLGVVLGDLAALGYDARWGVLGAIGAGAPHKRERIWIVAYAEEIICPGNTRSMGAKENKLQEGQEPIQSGFELGSSRSDMADADRLVCDRRTDEPGRETQERTAAARSGETLPDAYEMRVERARPKQQTARINELFRDYWWQSEPDVGRTPYGLA